MSANAYCSTCGGQHPASFTCHPASAPAYACGQAADGDADSEPHTQTCQPGAMSPEPEVHAVASSCCAGSHGNSVAEPTPQSATSCCWHAPEPPEPALLGQASATRAIYRIMNMDCPMEETLIRNRLGAMPGVTGLEFNLMQRVLTVNHSLASTEGIEQALVSIGMAPEPFANADPAMPKPSFAWGRLALAGLLAACAEVFELVLAWGNYQFLTGNLWGWMPGLLAVAAIMLGGTDTFKKGWIALKNRNLNINALMSVAVTGAFVIGQYPEAAMVMVLFSLAEAIEAKALDRARNAIRELLALTPETATVLTADGSWTETDVRQVPPGSLVRVKPGERVALDGVVRAGHSTINQAPITGESLPVEKSAGDLVYAGTINESGSFEFETTALAADTTLARIIHAVEEAQGSRAPIQRFVDTFAQYYTPAIFAAALLAAVVPPLFAGALWTESIYTALVILVIGCPCALVISTPVSIVSGMAAATRNGILVKGGMFLEQGRRLKWLALDKTGTITHGTPRETNWETFGLHPGEDVRTIAASLAARSDHPVSRAIAASARDAASALLEVSDFAALPGLGVRGRIAGQTWHLGNHRMVEELGKSSPELEKRISVHERKGQSVVMLAGPKGVHALFAVADTIRASSVEAIRELRRLGVKTMMLTGDNEHTARAIAAESGVDGFQAELLPEDKLAIVETLGQSGSTGMVGDGINDAPALARADIGFAMAAAGTDAAIETADVALMDDDLRKIPRFIRLSQATHAILVQNIVLALGVKALFFALALFGHATMWMAVFADVGTSLAVVANGLRAAKK